MLTREQFLLTKLAEECNEVAQMALKTQQFGMNECKPNQTLTNKDRLHDELNDLNAIIAMLNAECDFKYNPDSKKMIKKMDRVDTFYGLSHALGKVEG